MLWICYQQSWIVHTRVVLHIYCSPPCAPHIFKTSSLQVLKVLETMGTSLIALEGALSKMAKTSSKAAKVDRLLSLKDVKDVSEMKNVEAEKKIQKDKEQAQAQANSKARIERMNKWCCNKGKDGKRTSSTSFADASTEAKEKAAEAKVMLNLVIGTSNLEKAEEDACTAITAIEGLAERATEATQRYSEKLLRLEAQQAKEAAAAAAAAAAAEKTAADAAAAEAAAADAAAAEAAAAAAAPAAPATPSSRWNQLSNWWWGTNRLKAAESPGSSGEPMELWVGQGRGGTRYSSA